MGALALGYQDPYNLTDADLAKVKHWYLDHVTQVRAFYSSQSEFSDLYTKGDIVAAFGYKGYDVGLAKQSVPVAFEPASEGALTWTCGYAEPEPTRRTWTERTSSSTGSSPRRHRPPTRRRSTRCRRTRRRSSRCRARWPPTSA